MKTNAAIDEPVTMGVLDEKNRSGKFVDGHSPVNLHGACTNVSFSVGLQWADNVILVRMSNIEIILIVDGIMVVSEWIE